MEQLKRFSLGLAIWCVAALASAGIYDPPATYYNTATGTGTALRNQLHNLIDNHTVYSYDALRSILQVTDADPDDSDNIILVYDRTSLDVSNLNSSGIPGWGGNGPWNREHTWPKSYGIGESGPDYSDLHQLRPSLNDINSDRGNLHFGGAFGQSFGEVNDGGAVWYPGDLDAGMIARQEFYMDVRYDGSDSATNDLVLRSGIPTASNSLGNLNRLLEWHYLVPPDDFELRRNDIIFDSYQHNRNPFVDRPEYVWSVFVDEQNDSRIAIDGALIDAAGASVRTIDLGRVFVGAGLPAAQSITLDKLGNDGTYFEVTTTGDATSELVGRYHAFRTGGTDSTSFDVGLATSTAVAGRRTGTVTIDNLDVTTGGGLGRGALDGDDLISLTLDVLDHGRPSFAAQSEATTLDLDFGLLPASAEFPTIDFDVFNLESTLGFTADLQLSDVLPSGDFESFTTNFIDVGMFSDLAAGAGATITATFDTSSIGEFAATFMLEFEDEDLLGAANSTSLVLNLTGEVVSPAQYADFNGDGTINGRDVLAWQRGSSPNSLAGVDLATWESQFGTTTPTGITVPEPTTLALWLLGITVCRRERKRSCDL